MLDEKKLEYNAPRPYKEALSREDKRELQKITRELLTLAERVKKLTTKAASQE